MGNLKRSAFSLERRSGLEKTGKKRKKYGKFHVSAL
jgi:hypothetical protein